MRASPLPLPRAGDDSCEYLLQDRRKYTDGTWREIGAHVPAAAASRSCPVEAPSVCMCVCVCIYSIAHNRAIRPCHPSHSMPLALILAGGDQMCVCVCVCVCVFIKLHKTAKFGPVIPGHAVLDTKCVCIKVVLK